MNNRQLAAIEFEIVKERLRQARRSFDTALASSITFTGFSLLGAVLLIGGTVTEGAAISSVSIVSSVGCIRLVKDSNDRLDKLIEELRSSGSGDLDQRAIG